VYKAEHEHTNLVLTLKDIRTQSASNAVWGQEGPAIGVEVRLMAEMLSWSINWLLAVGFVNKQLLFLWLSRPPTLIAY